jgi:predicted RND superfamily exporter protein
MGVNDDTSSGLGSLAQAARGKQLRQARNILITIGVLTVLFNAFLLMTVRSRVRADLDRGVQKVRAQGMQVDQSAVQQIEESLTRLNYLITGVLIFLGILFVVFGFIVQLYPVPVTILSLTLYIGAAVIFGILDPATLLQGIIFKIIIVVALAKAIQSAITYQQEQARAANPEPTYD